MKKYRIELKETVSYYGEIEADSLQEALDKAEKLAADNEFPNDEQCLDDAVLSAWDDNGDLVERSIHEE